MTRPTRGQGRRNRGRGKSRGRGRPGWQEVEDRRLPLVRSVNRQQGTRRQQSPSPTRRENSRQLTYNQEGLRDGNF
jgi:hypothetical protein